ncbi:uncharacterized protein BX663DRAFT_505853 [Cokeromyces recurvatus]|uniref:uncharacterized protein n=1 Tax=Cokeromyces recurvatus TaxID=90255 RepID=UPI0022204D00|nr:uncharacterized protein BX663DRAFT_505853 [Cokeromyces recurvatus]KAI7903954.1 hypothetical protein BX663DRAFT_505853 [Cokeromyces recurvatus]
MQLSTIGCVLFTPFILLVVIFLAILAIITSTITSSFIFFRLTLLGIEIISDLTIESTNWLLSTCIERIKGYLHIKKENHERPSIVIRRKNNLPSSASLSLSRLPYKATIKSKYSISVPGTPDPELHHYHLVAT